eukprot:TRINITY_DN21544_c0_g1_i4.p1 TRINITY_DN21544_c0_g1~~TRINITY_DN21544_c0_g1_i4.p1  ORF type:complete len:100 (+),score=12.79 TRINITY_DN21544_c0_g1_i4:2-301(+)
MLVIYDCLCNASFFFSHAFTLFLLYVYISFLYFYIFFFYFSLVFFFFFFQAEDGIRDAQESRGLGDVYKRQGITYGGRALDGCGAVSYTHLTLPTKRIV